MNRQAQLLTIVAAVLTIVYPFIKRFVSVPQFILGAAFGWAVPMAFAAATGDTPRVAWLMFGAALVWAVIYDTFYAMVDREDDLKIGVKSTAILFGDADLFILGILQIVMLLALGLIGTQVSLGFWYFLSLFVAACLMLYHQRLARNREREGCFKAFLHNHYIGMVVFIGIVLHYNLAPAG